MNDDGDMHVCEDYILVGELYRCPDCGEGVYFVPRRGPPMTEDSGEFNSGQFICWECDEDGKVIDQSKLTMCEVGISKTVDKYLNDADMLQYLMMTVWSEANR